jgi:hypothetical protein
MADAVERNSRLDTLGIAIKEWATSRRKKLKQQVSFSKRLLKGRTGSERLAQASVESASSLTVDEIDDFLTGDT